MDYSELYAIRAQKAVDTGVVDFNALVEELIGDGVSAERINSMLIDDLENNGPIFGKFFRSLGYAGGASIKVAEVQGATAAELMSLDDDIAAFAEEARLGARVRDGDPDALQAIEDAAERKRLTWVAALRATCPTCLPLHGKSMTLAEWKELGYRPGAVHPNCECAWMSSELAADYQDLMEPLRREIKPGQKRGGRRTQRAVTQPDVDAAMRERDKALDTKDGRAVMRALGQVGGGQNALARMRQRITDDGRQ